MSVAGVTLFGILNVTRDSFSDGGRWLDPVAAVDHGLAMLEQGADAIDVGAASSHPDAEEVTAAEEIRRLAPVIEALVARGASVSVDTWRTEVQRFAIEAGADWINDIRGFRDSPIRGDLAMSSARLVVMHSVDGAAKASRRETDAESVWRGMLSFFDARVDELDAAGVPRGRLVLDPGMGFFLGSDPAPSVLVLHRLHELRERYGLDVLVSVSRKSFVARLAGIEPAPARVAGRAADPRAAATLAVELFAVLRGATMIRTHEPGPLRDALAVTAALSDPGAR